MSKLNASCNEAIASVETKIGWKSLLSKLSPGRYIHFSRSVTMFKNTEAGFGEWNVVHVFLYA